VFCPQCNAPQIRVAGAEPALTPGPVPQVLPPHSPSVYPGYFPSNRIQWSQALPGAVIGGAVSAILMVIPLGALGLGMLVGGSLAVLLYHRRTASENLTAGMGARLGAVSGVIGFGIFALLAAIEMVVRRNSGEFRAALFEAIQQSAARTPGPEAQQMMAWLKTPAGLTFLVAFGLAVTFVFFVVISSVGGAIGAVLLRRREKP
jgi:hypothetical protein